MTFDPNQPRDRECKWTETGGGGRRGGSSNPMNSLGRWKQKGIPPGQGPGPLKISGAKTLNQMPAIKLRGMAKRLACGAQLVVHFAARQIYDRSPAQKSMLRKAEQEYKTVHAIKSVLRSRK